MAMPLASEYHTADMVRAMPDDGNRYEVVWGELLVSPSPRWVHQRVLKGLVYAVDPYVMRHGLGELAWSPADISWGPDTLVQPDLFVVAPGESGGVDWAQVKTLRLVAEVLSPSTARHDRFQKRRLYQSRGVGTLWLVDIDRRVVEVWTPEATFPAVEGERITWHPPEAPEPLVIALEGLFGAG